MDTSKKTLAVKLRQRGLSFSQIQAKIGYVPKSTLSTWFRNVSLTDDVISRKRKRELALLVKARSAALLVKESKRREYLAEKHQSNTPLREELRRPSTAKIALSMLYLGEGSKNSTRGALVFGNSDPDTIRLFLGLLRRCYKLDESKFRCTVQCRADQETDELAEFWSNITDIPKKQFYRAQIDKRTVGKPSRRLAYKGVCRIDYFSADIFNDILQAIRVIKGL